MISSIELLFLQDVSRPWKRWQQLQPIATRAKLAAYAHVLMHAYRISHASVALVIIIGSKKFFNDQQSITRRTNSVFDVHNHVRVYAKIDRINRGILL